MISGFPMTSFTAFDSAFPSADYDAFSSVGLFTRLTFF